MKRYDRFVEFYAAYLKMHSHPINRRLHLLGNALAIGALIYAIAASCIIRCGERSGTGS